jgi:iron(III) transport system permease protein
MTLFVLVAFLLYPIGTTLLNSFAPSGEKYSGSIVTIENLVRFWTSSQYKNAQIKTVIIGLAVTVLSTLVAVPVAYFVARVKMPFKPLILSLSIIPLISPPFIGAYSWVILFGRSGIVSQYLNAWFGFQMPPIYGFFGIILAMVLSHFTFVFLFVLGALTAADPHLEESARVMGASRWRVARTVILPLAIPPMLAGAMIVLIEALGEFGIPAILGGEVYVLSTLMYFQIHGLAFQPTALSGQSLTVPAPSRQPSPDPQRPRSGQGATQRDRGRLGLSGRGHRPRLHDDLLHSHLPALA